jgi:hypothetical protein
MMNGLFRKAILLINIMKDYRDEWVLIHEVSALFILLGMNFFPIKSTMTSYGTHGDFVGGTLGSGITVWLVFLTYRLQNKS